MSSTSFPTLDAAKIPGTRAAIHAYAQVLGNWAWVITDSGGGCVALLPNGSASCVATAACDF